MINHEMFESYCYKTANAELLTSDEDDENTKIINDVSKNGKHKN
jgi:hypothetical protein